MEPCGPDSRGIPGVPGNPLDHSIHECFSVANLLDGHGEGQLDLGLGLGDSSRPDEYVSDYGWLLRGKDGEHMQAAAEIGFRKLIDLGKEEGLYREFLPDTEEKQAPPASTSQT